MVEPCVHARSGPGGWRRRAPGLCGGDGCESPRCRCRRSGNRPRFWPRSALAAQRLSAASARVRRAAASRCPYVLYGMPGARADLRVRLVQVRARASRPAGEPVDIAAGVDFGAGLRRELSVDVMVPAVDRESRFELTVFLRAPRAATGARSEPCRSVPTRTICSSRSSDGPSGNPFASATPPASSSASWPRRDHVSRPERAISSRRATGTVVTVLVDGTDDLARAKARARRGEAVVLLRERAGA